MLCDCCALRPATCSDLHVTTRFDLHVTTWLDLAFCEPKLTAAFSCRAKHPNQDIDLAVSNVSRASAAATISVEATLHLLQHIIHSCVQLHDQALCSV
jgi:hypothetical protein